MFDLKVPLRDRSRTSQWLVLILVSVILSTTLELLHVPAALLLGPMLAAIVMCLRQSSIQLHMGPFFLAQGVIACMIGKSITLPMLGQIMGNWGIFISGVLFAVAASALLGWLLAHKGVLPGTTAIWGSSPGGATAMVVMADSYDADMRLVAVMQYLRVVVVALTASLVAAIWGGSPAQAAPVDWFPATDWTAFATTCVVISIGALAGLRLRIPGGAFQVPLVLCVGLQDAGLMEITLPPWFLVLSYACIGWGIGQRFNREIMAYAARILPKIMACILTLIAVCALFGLFLGHVAHVDPLTAYLATSPGGADSVAIIAASCDVDLPFVMAMQTVRFMVVLLVSPAIARAISRRISASAN
ncbi:AbrB family transcriptional regulator [Desulfocurvus sp. DL9XJH121]